MKGANRHQSSEMRLPTCVARFEDSQAACRAILRLAHGSVMYGPAAITPNPETAPLWLLGPPVQFTAPELHDCVEIGLVYEGGYVVRGNSPRMPTEPAVMYQVLAGAVHAVRNASV